MKKLILIDGNSLLYRAFYATAYSGTLMRSTKGVTTNALYSFTRMMMSLIQANEFSHILVAFDAGKKTFRHEQYPEYKGGRKPTPPELHEQMPLARKLLEVLNVKHYELEGYEADDIIGTMAKKAIDAGFELVEIYSGDRDLLQLVDEKVHVKLTVKGLSEVEENTIASLKAKYGLTPRQIVDLKGLMGDSSDNIPGIPGVGEKTALQLLSTYGSVENLIARVDDLKGKLYERVRDNQNLALLSKELATINRNAPLTLTLDDTEYLPYDENLVLDFFNEYDFHSLITQYQIKEKVQSLENEVFNYRILIHEDEVKDYLVPNAYVVIEVFGQNYHKGEVLGMALSSPKGNVFVPFSLMKTKLVQDYLKTPEIKKYTFDYKRAYVALKYQGIDFNGVDFDLLTAAYILNPKISSPDFRVIAANFNEHQVNYDHEIYGKNTRYALPIEAIYAEHTVKKAYTLRKLHSLVIKQLEDNEQLPIYQDIELPLSKVLGEMEYAGIKLDLATLAELSEELKDKIVKLEIEIYDLAGRTFNISSPKQLGEILFDELKLPTVKKTKTGYSTDIEVLQKLVGQHPIIEKIMEYRTYTKLNSTYVEGLKDFVYPDGKLHTIFNQTLTQTGRLSSIEPNIQNIPIRTELGREVRKAFVPSTSENFIVSADYSQIELRILAHLAQVERLIEAFQHNLDIHTKTAMDVFGLARDQVTPDERRKAKAVNFGIIYGMSAFGLSENLHISPKEAQQFIDQYYQTYPGIKSYMEQVVKNAKEKGYVETIFKRRRYIEELKSSNYNVRSFGERTAMNAPIQGSAADIIKIAMINVQKRMEQAGLRSKMLIQVHDELVFEVVPEELETMLELIQTEMEGAEKLLVPLKVEINYGKNWYEAK